MATKTISGYNDDFDGGGSVSNSTDIAIVGAGPAGLGAANKLSRDFVLFEKESQPGGLMRSKHINGYTFDWAGHIFFTRINRINKWIEELMEDNFHWINRESWVFSKNVYTRYPFQANTYGLPPSVIKECLMALIETTYLNSKSDPANFQEWIYDTYGEGIASHFMIPYNRKIWARDLTTMDHLWLAGRVPKPGLEEFIDGALGPGRKDMGPNARFGYPLNGGMASLVEKLVHPVKDNLQLNSRVSVIDPAAKQITLQDGQTYTYKHLLLTNPLPETLKITKNIPSEVLDAGSKLEYLSVLCVNIGIKQPALTKKHWIYFPESEFLFHRIFVQGNASPNVCPDNCFSYTAEITYNSSKIINFDTAGDQTVDGLIRANLLKNTTDVDTVDLIDIPIGYVVPTHGKDSAMSVIRDWYRQFDIHLVGRFAEWAYYNMDHSLDAGWSLAENLTRE